MMRFSSRNIAGFSLVELSVVLVILGLLAGGILSGRNLIRAAQIRAVGAEYQHYQTAIYSFRDTYDALPGDFAQATRFWGAVNQDGSDGNCANPLTDTGSGRLTCNGNGNGVVATYHTSSEMWRFWQHLANAGLIHGQYSGVHGQGGIGEGVPGKNVPASKLTRGGWAALTYAPRTSPSDTTYASPYGLVFNFGSTYQGTYPYHSVLYPHEAENIDLKYDDGMPATGYILSFRAGGQHSGECATSPDAALAYYNVKHNQIACALIIRTGL